MRSHDKRIIHSSTEANWRTDPELFGALRRQYPFTWDCMANPQASLVGKCFWGPGSRYGQDFLKIRKADIEKTVAVTGRPFVGFINPPSSRKQGIDIGPFIVHASKLARYAPCTIVGVVPAGWQTKWWAAAVHNKAWEIRTLPYRLSFLTPDGESSNNANVNHVIVEWRSLRGYIGFSSHVTRWTYREDD